jgi:hypothetical protein
MKNSVQVQLHQSAVPQQPMLGKVITIIIIIDMSNLQLRQFQQLLVFL